MTAHIAGGCPPGPERRYGPEGNVAICHLTVGLRDYGDRPVFTDLRRAQALGNSPESRSFWRPSL